MEADFSGLDTSAELRQDSNPRVGCEEMDESSKRTRGAISECMHISIGFKFQ